MASANHTAPSLPNYHIDPALASQTRVPQIVAGVLVPTVFASIFAFARFYTRAVLTRNWGIDDYFMLISWSCSVVLAVLNCVYTKYGLGHHTLDPFAMNDSSAANLVATLKLAVATQMTYQFILYATRISICFFYLRIFQDRTSKILAYTFIVCMTLIFVPTEFATILRCRPVDYAWSMEHLFDKTCANRWVIVWVSAVGNIVGDVAVMLFVIPKILPLNMRKREKYSVIFIVSFGFLVIAASILRLVRVLQNGNSIDSTWTGYDIGIWSSVEISTGIFCASAPCIRPLIRKIAPWAVASEVYTASNPSYTRRTNNHPPSISRVATRRRDVQGFELESKNSVSSLPFSRREGNTDVESAASEASGDAILKTEHVCDEKVG